MILPDSSAWVAYFRATGSAVGVALKSLVDVRARLVTSGLVVMEVLTGARSERDARSMRSVLGAYPLLRLRQLDDFEEAASLYRTCRAAGETIRSLSDCLIAVQAIRAGASVLHRDRDFDVIARHTELRIEPIGK